MTPQIQQRVVLAILAACLATTSCGSTKSWYKGNTHTHTLWSDGNAAPELVVSYYTDNSYDFLVLSDHNILSEGEKWFPVNGGRLTEEKLQGLVDRFGTELVTVRDEPQREMRLQTLDELRTRFEVPGQFLLVQGEEVTDSWDKYPVHINAVNIEQTVAPQHGDSVADTIRRNMEAIHAEGERSGREVLAHLNHPNFGWGVTVDEVAAMPLERFFEVYNGHSGVRNYGDAEHPSMESMWDLALVTRLEHNGLGLLYGVATDDSHDYYSWGPGKTNPGRGWVVVYAESLESDDIVRAMKAGDFYASSGVTLSSIEKSASSLSVAIEPIEDVVYTTQFIGTLGGHGEHEIGVVLAETKSNPAVYSFTGDELYVRAQVVSSLDHPNPYAEGDKQTAWVQPVLVKQD
ncbi:MAG: histidinol-phosphatase [Planctomycetota bacterium]|nr:histidinol-phosphatase [Planctomycetota bacterium]MDG2142844.1 histidinol-phosphatase [Planctomycetota bacterium]